MTGRSEHDPETGVIALESGSRQAMAELAAQVRHHLVDGRQRIVIDLTGLGRLSSAAVTELLSAKRCVTARGGQVVVSGCSAASLHTLARAGLVARPERAVMSAVTATDPFDRGPVDRGPADGAAFDRPLDRVATA